jgi:hypothetical protein
MTPLKPIVSRQPDGRYFASLVLDPTLPIVTAHAATALDARDTCLTFACYQIAHELTAIGHHHLAGKLHQTAIDLGTHQAQRLVLDIITNARHHDRHNRQIAELTPQPPREPSHSHKICEGVSGEPPHPHRRRPPPGPPDRRCSC